MFKKTITLVLIILFLFSSIAYSFSEWESKENVSKAKYDKLLKKYKNFYSDLKDGYKEAVVDEAASVDFLKYLEKTLEKYELNIYYKNGKIKNKQQNIYSFKNNLDDWTIGYKFLSERCTRGQGNWNKKYDGSVKLHVAGGPDHVGLYRQFKKGLDKGDTIIVNYESPNLNGEPGGPRILLHKPNGENTNLDWDQGRKDDKPDGILQGTLEKDYPPGTYVEVRNGVWPGKITVFVKSIKINKNINLITE